MPETADDVDVLRCQIADLESQLDDLKRRLAAAGDGAAALTRPSEPAQSSSDWKWPLEAEEYKRYGRQMIMPEVGLQGDSWTPMFEGRGLTGSWARTATSEEGLRADCWRGRSGLSRCSVPCGCWSWNPWSH